MREPIPREQHYADLYKLINQGNLLIETVEDHASAIEVINELIIKDDPKYDWFLSAYAKLVEKYEKEMLDKR